MIKSSLKTTAMAFIMARVRAERIGLLTMKCKALQNMVSIQQSSWHIVDTQ